MLFNVSGFAGLAYLEHGSAGLACLEHSYTGMAKAIQPSYAYPRFRKKDTKQSSVSDTNNTSEKAI